MKSFFRIKKIHGKEYKYEIIPYYDKENRKIRRRSKYIGPVSNGKVVEKTVTTYSYSSHEYSLLHRLLFLFIPCAPCNTEVLVSSYDLQFQLLSMFSFHLKVCFLNGIRCIINHGHMC